MNIIDRFLNYVSYYTTSDETSETIPSSARQKVLGADLVKEMKAMGIEDAYMDEFGYVYGSIPATKEDIPAIGFIAHMDTSPDITGENVKPRIEKNYDGGDIVLNAEENIVLSPVDYPTLSRYKGLDIIVTDGKTLLGADDKAGIAAILSACEKIMASDEPHGKIYIGFTPDEEIGRGADKFDLDYFKAKFAYTVDGGTVGGLDYENFNAASGLVTVYGKNIHPGSAKLKMKNSLLIAMEFQNLLPVFENPMYTEMYEGFAHLNQMSGDVEKTVMTYILRDHDEEKLEKRKQIFEAAAEFLNKKYGDGTVNVKLQDNYQNMRQVIEKHMYILDYAKKAMLKAGLEPEISPVRGGTDGARLSFMGLPCPNIFTGGENMHGRFEYIPVQSLEKCAEVIENIIYEVANN